MNTTEAIIKYCSSACVVYWWQHIQHYYEKEKLHIFGINPYGLENKYGHVFKFRQCDQIEKKNLQIFTQGIIGPKNKINNNERIPHKQVWGHYFLVGDEPVHAMKCFNVTGIKTLWWVLHVLRTASAQETIIDFPERILCFPNFSYDKSVHFEIKAAVAHKTFIKIINCEWHSSLFFNRYPAIHGHIRLGVGKLK